MSKAPSHLNAVLLAILVTFLWSSSWVLIKIGLKNDLPALSFAGMRYTLAFLCLIPIVLVNRFQRAILQSLDRMDWMKLTLLGLIYYTLAQGAQFVSLAYLPSVMVSLLLNLSPIVVGFMSLAGDKEPPTFTQWLGITLSVAGTLIYFLPIAIPQAKMIGVLAALVGILSNSYATVLSRQVNQQKHLSPLVVTFVSMGIGSTLMLLTGWLTQGLGHPSLLDWGIIAWLAIINTALAFTLWSHTQRTLTAVETSIVNSLMLPQIAILAFAFLGETITAKEISGLALVGIGVLIIQLRKSRESGILLASSKG